MTIVRENVLIVYSIDRLLAYIDWFKTKNDVFSTMFFFYLLPSIGWIANKTE